ncbi:PREDICTED: dual specificity mitogen-activated protein kinase kinase 5-like [Priapulus caudatus]|uniref:mitogen-activated protein kinase kinase n=1 Tax=Priapulus caudatus TaxID=37621 RepID=A0ABM1EQI0_PRICU|nr:PREDICTED: dual specificity mitogen-activated protein kinase kinase 5-like [Priapulus caudatus]XP_014674451.1 PREDICTED: dual specificity mitogen-activated protein kinase kinase 5-like [Priapulus caudatus]
MTMQEALLQLCLRVPGEEDTDITLPLATANHNSTMETVSRVLNQTVEAFDYEDEEGDIITVRGEEDFSAMITMYLEQLQDALNTGSQLTPLLLHPRVGKTAGKRNLHGLKIQTYKTSEEEVEQKGDSGGVFIPETSDDACMDTSPVRTPGRTPTSVKQQHQDITAILALGHINNSDLEYLEKLGHGSGGTVYRAEHRPNKLVMAVKVIPLDITPSVQKEIMSELEVLYKCNSPVIIDFYGAYFIENRISICTEFMDGGSLDRYGQIEELVVGRIAVAVVKGLLYLWSLKIMHRDVKPSNILVNTRGQIKLCDFGVSTQLVNSIALTFIGTNAYMAPERIRGHEYSIHSEVWSVGISLLEMALGRFPYESQHASPETSVLRPLELLHRILSEEPPSPPSDLYSVLFRDFVSKCMKQNPRERPRPEQLMKHPLIVVNDDNNTAVIATWLQEKLQARHVLPPVPL